jgi:hypothetical protein
MPDPLDQLRDDLLQRMPAIIAQSIAEGITVDHFTSHLFKSSLEIGSSLEHVPYQNLPYSPLWMLSHYLSGLAERAAYEKTPRYQLELQHKQFTAQLQSRQGTKLPDFESFYKQREELNRRLDEPTDTEH